MIFCRIDHAKKMCPLQHRLFICRSAALSFHVCEINTEPELIKKERIGFQAYYVPWNKHGRVPFAIALLSGADEPKVFIFKFPDCQRVKLPHDSVSCKTNFYGFIITNR